MPPEELSTATADRDTLERLAQSTEVDTEAVQPGIGVWFDDATHAMGQWWLELFADRLGSVSWFAYEGTLWVLRALFVVLVVLAGLFVARLIRRPRTELPAGEVHRPKAESEPVPGAARWLRRMEECLADGDVRGASQALWWWVASRLGDDALGDGGPDAAWTTRELLHHTHAPGEMQRLGDRLDAMIYGPQMPTVEGVRELQSQWASHPQLMRSADL